MPMDCETLVSALSQHRLLEPEQLKQIQGIVSSGGHDASRIIRELVQRGWLTQHQANQLAKGRAAELTLGPYQLLEKLGEGGMGAVYKARNLKLGRLVALKLIRKERLAGADAIKRFHREIRAAAQLQHANVVRAYDADEIGGTHFFVMEYVEGTDLSKMIKERGALPVNEACELVRQAALGLQHAFERGMVHRDIKPANLLLVKGQSGDSSSAGTVKILDMGLARVTQDAGEESTTITREGSIMGTPDYIAPEQALSSHEVDIRADIYSLGCTLYHMVTGQVPFPGGSMTEKLLKHQLQAPTPAEQLRPDLTPEVGRILQMSMAKRPDQRFQTPAQMAEALLMARAGAGTSSTVAMTSRAPSKAVLQPTIDESQELKREWAGLVQETAPLVTPQQVAPSQAMPWRWIAIAAGVLVLLIGGFLVLQSILRNRGGDEVAQKDKPDRDKPLKDKDKVVKKAGPAADRDKPFVLVRGAKATAEFKTIEEALASHLDGEAIEIHGNGPYTMENALTLKARNLTIRAGDGYRPRLVPGDTILKKGQNWFNSSGGTVRIEGCDLLGGSKNGQFVASGVLEIRNCRLLSQAGQYLMQFRGKQLRLEDSLVVMTTVHAGIHIEANADVEIKNCILIQTGGSAVIGRKKTGTTRFKLEHNIFFGRAFHLYDDVSDTVNANGNLFHGSVFGFTPQKTLPRLHAAANNIFLPGAQVRGKVDDVDKNLDLAAWQTEAGAAGWGRQVEKLAFEWQDRPVGPKPGAHVWTKTILDAVATLTDGPAVRWDKVDRVIADARSWQTQPAIKEAGIDLARIAVRTEGGERLLEKDKVVPTPPDLPPGGVVQLIDPKLSAWTTSTGAPLDGWAVGKAVPTGKRLDIKVEAGGNDMVIVGGKRNIQTKQEFGDCIVETEVMVAAGGNSGIYLNGHYEVQIFDTFGKAGDRDMGALYGVAAPRVLAAGKPDEWQTLRIDFQAPRFEGDKKVANARLRKVVLNGKVIHEDVDIPRILPAGLPGPERPTGPIFLQGDHGAGVAYRNFRVLVPSATVVAELATGGTTRWWLPWVSRDGLDIYWEVETDKTSTIWSARRKDARSPFADKKAILPGRHPGVRHDGLEIIYVVGNRLVSARRPAGDRSFEAPRDLPFSVLGTKTSMPFLSGDGLTLLFQVREKTAAVFHSATRTTLDAPWSDATPLPLKPPADFDHMISWPFLTDDGLTLLCVHEMKAGNRFMLWTRGSVEEPFREPRYLEVPGVPELAGRSPRWIPATRELFFCAPPKLAEAGVPNWPEVNIWVLRNFDLPRESPK